MGQDRDIFAEVPYTKKKKIWRATKCSSLKGHHTMSLRYRNPTQMSIWGGVEDGQDRTGQDVLPEMPYIHHIGYWRWQLRHCIKPHIQEPNPNVHSDLSIGGVGDRQDRMGQEVLPKMPYIHHIGYWRWQLRHCIEPQIQEPSPNVHSNMSLGGVGEGTDRHGMDVLNVLT